MKPILSQQNPNYKRWRQILEPRGIKKFSQTLVSGRKIIPEILQQQTSLIDEILVDSESMAEEWQIEGQKQVFVLQKSHFKELDILGTGAPLLIVKIPKVDVWNPDSPPKGLELVVAMGDPSNLGAVIRSAEAFRVSKIILLKESAHAFHPKVTKSSSGSNFRVRIEKGPSISDVATAGVWALDMDGTNINSVDLPGDLRLLIGEEGQGIPKDVSPDHRLSIPMSASVESLNATVAASIAIYHILNR